MKAKLIKNDTEHAAALTRIEEIFGATPGTPEGDECELLVHLVEEYEAEHHAIDLPDPVEAIKFRMEQQGLKQVDLVPYIGNKSKVSEVLSRKRPLSLAMIRKLHDGLRIPAQVLLQEPGRALSPLYDGIDWKQFPLTEMLKRDWFPGFEGRANDLAERGEELLGPLLFPNGQDCRDLDMAARQGKRLGSNSDDCALWAWQARVLQLSCESDVGEYASEAMTETLMRSVISLSRLEDGPLQACRLLERNGIAVVILHHLPGTHLDGLAMMRPDGHPVVALTLRHDRLDNFWFTLAHELAHVVIHLSKGDRTVFLDDLEGSGTKTKKEREADKLAADLLIPTNLWKSSRLGRNASALRIREVAMRAHVSPAIVAGRVRYETDNYKNRTLNALVGERKLRKQFQSYKAGVAA
ncbi:MAG: ImmA/IrrE family metallo-endopeptidase [Spartobacteria bacterium]|nr:ImmA/IrrE family metallo-endopeptidase [Spartobacteria bacterium]